MLSPTATDATCHIQCGDSQAKPCTGRVLLSLAPIQQCCTVHMCGLYSFQAVTVGLPLKCTCRSHRIHLADMPGMVARIKKQGEGPAQHALRVAVPV